MATKIEWTDETWNPVTGCSKVSAGCAHCYAERLFARSNRRKCTVEPSGMMQPRIFTDVAWHPDRFVAPLRWSRPRRVFVNSMSDLFHEAIPFEVIAAIFGVMARAKRHTFQVLTKRPEQMLQWFRWISTGATPSLDCAAHLLDFERQHVGDGGPVHCRWGPEPDAAWPLSNVWLGVSAEDQACADVRIPVLLDVPARVRFASLEPLLGPIDLARLTIVTPSPPFGPGVWIDSLRGLAIGPDDVLPHKLDWIIVGGESGPRSRYIHPDWVRSIRDQCSATDVPFFFKQWGGPRPKMRGRRLDGRLHDDYPRGGGD